MKHQCPVDGCTSEWYDTRNVSYKRHLETPHARCACGWVGIYWKQHFLQAGRRGINVSGCGLWEWRAGAWWLVNSVLETDDGPYPEDHCICSSRRVNPDCPQHGERNLYAIAQRVTDEALGEGTYALLNEHHPDPGVQAVIRHRLCSDHWSGAAGCVRPYLHVGKHRDAAGDEWYVW